MFWHIIRFSLLMSPGVTREKVEGFREEWNKYSTVKQLCLTMMAGLVIVMPIVLIIAFLSAVYLIFSSL